ncbi:hypothetical protein GCM10007301_24380 [Azorhizobium oxalatiphilum]|uniref:Cytochrome c domain-containing protein n=1 Tax=Azorhizobium oxalatiphilum TaxID=980631 RepID=A0A917BYH7_9HYPH|nr:cytochrome c [Azorhizobium oxalatiphilum]GGF63719.1 hypothetical protein GCM10007301_24380 [Azorhizobium oxalatiphilum]
MAKSKGRIRRILVWSALCLAGLVIVIAVAGLLVVRSIIEADTAAFGTKPDEAKIAKRTPQSLPASSAPYFAAMDKGLLLPPAPGQPYPPEILQIATDLHLPPEEVRLAAIRGQNSWIVWTGGNDRFWNYAALNTFGAFDLLKTVSSHPSQDYGRHNRWRYLGLVNEPCFRQAEGPDETRFGLWLDRRAEGCEGGADPFGGNAEADKAYPGVAIGARGKPLVSAGTVGGGGTGAKTFPVGSFYGEPSGVMGLRLFPNPDFDEAAQKRWDPVRYYTDDKYYNDATLVRPYRVGMSCAFCHVGPNPIKPPRNVEEPRFEELTSNPGAQYYWVDRIFFWNTGPRKQPGVPAPNEGNFLFQLFHTNPPGSLDTSLVSTDYMNNPRTMNAVYEVRARVGIALNKGQERLKGGETDNKQFQDYAQTRALAGWWDPGSGLSGSMRVLKDGSDSVGTLGALNRVYLNIGLFSEEWLLHFRPFAGGRKISPIRISDAKLQSVYWNATEDRTADMAIFFLVTARADRLKDLPKDIAQPPAANPAQLDRGKVVFAQNCAACHSSKQPEPPLNAGVDTGVCAGGGAGPQYRECWDRYWSWAQSDEFKRGMIDLVTEKVRVDNEGFLENNYLSTDRRVPLDILGTNACTAVATNGLSGDIWDNFTSSTYKTLPPPKEVTVHHPVSGAAMPFRPLGNGRGYIRPASLVSVWSSAPYLANNSVGHDDYFDRPYSAAYGGYAGPKAADQKAADQRAAMQPTAAGTVPAPVPAGGYTTNYVGSTACPAADVNDPDMPCVANRLALFDRSIRQMLWPETRRRDKLTTEPVPGYIYRTSAPSCLQLPAGFMPPVVKRFGGVLHSVAGWAFDEDGGVHIGPFPSGFPINTLTNTKLLPDNDEPDVWRHYVRLIKAGPGLIKTFATLGGTCTPADLANPEVDARAKEVVAQSGLIDTLVGLSKCPDYVVNGGHEFGAGLSAPDKEALISFLRTL